MQNAIQYTGLIILLFCLWAVIDGKENYRKWSAEAQAHEIQIANIQQLKFERLIRETAGITVKKPTRRPLIKHVDDKELLCLAKNIFFEARGTDTKEQIRIVNVTTNRVKSENYPNTYCGVIYDHAQFSWTLDLATHNINIFIKQRIEREAWESAKELARKELEYGHPDTTAGAIYYHAPYVNPKWAYDNQRILATNYHIYYRPYVN